MNITPKTLFRPIVSSAQSFSLRLTASGIGTNNCPGGEVPAKCERAALRDSDVFIEYAESGEATVNKEKITAEEEKDATNTIPEIQPRENESTPVSVDIKPMEAPVISIGKSLDLIADFGGVTAYWVNMGKAEISVVLEMKDEYGDFMPIDIYYSSAENGSASTRGMDPEARDFRIFVKDKWGNKSNSLEKNLTPFFEEKFNMLKFSPLALEGDEPADFGWVIPRLWDGSTTGENGFHTGVGTGRWPQTFSVDMKQTGKISRIKLWQRWDGGWL